MIKRKVRILFASTISVATLFSVLTVDFIICLDALCYAEGDRRGYNFSSLVVIRIK